MLTAEQKQRLSETFKARMPEGNRGADVYLEAESFRMYSPLDNGDLVVPLALSSLETMDIAINPVCAARMAATFLDLLSRSGDYVIDLALYETATGDQLFRLRP